MAVVNFANMANVTPEPHVALLLLLAAAEVGAEIRFKPVKSLRGFCPLLRDLLLLLLGGPVAVVNLEGDLLRRGLWLLLRPRLLLLRCGYQHRRLVRIRSWRSRNSWRINIQLLFLIVIVLLLFWLLLLLLLLLRFRRLLWFLLLLL